MLYSNKEFKVIEKEMNFGQLKVIELGNKNPRSRQIVIPSNFDINKGVTKNLTIGLSKSGKPKIVKGDDKDYIYLLLSSFDFSCFHRQGVVNYTIFTGVECLAKAKHTDGLAGKAGTAEEKLLKVPVDGKERVFRVHLTYGEDENDKDRDRLIFVKNRNIIIIKGSELPYYLENRNSIYRISDFSYIFEDSIDCINLNTKDSVLDMIAGKKLLSYHELVEQYNLSNEDYIESELNYYGPGDRKPYLVLTEKQLKQFTDVFGSEFNNNYLEKRKDIGKLAIYKLTHENWVVNRIKLVQFLYINDFIKGGK